MGTNPLGWEWAGKSNRNRWRLVDVRSDNDVVIIWTGRQENGLPRFGRIGLRGGEKGEVVQAVGVARE